MQKKIKQLFYGLKLEKVQKNLNLDSILWPVWKSSFCKKHDILRDTKNTESQQKH